VGGGNRLTVGDEESTAFLLLVSGVLVVWERSFGFGWGLEEQRPLLLSLVKKIPHHSSSIYPAAASHFGQRQMIDHLRQRTFKRKINKGRGRRNGASCLGAFVVGDGQHTHTEQQKCTTPETRLSLLLRPKFINSSREIPHPTHQQNNWAYFFSIPPKNQ
jgi:hypothetical protein